MMKKQYQFGHVNIEVHMPEGMPIPENMQKFMCESEHADRTYEIEYAQSLDEIEQTLRQSCPQAREIRRENLRVLTSSDKECRILNFHGADRPYGIVLEEVGEPIRVWVDEEIRPMLIYDTIFVSLLALEKLMIQHDSLILHSAYMLRDGKAILFSAPSETGKSTQADLWERYRGTRTVNGDRSLLIREKDGWYAYGWPVCGSSKICHNESYPIQAIVMLHQSKTNEIVRIQGFEAVQKLMAQITINMWNTEYQIKTMDLIEEMIGDIPVYELGCDISEEAVRCLEKELKKID